jgi:hypothetical protein
MAKEFHIPFIRVRVGRFLFLLISMVLMFVLRPFLEGYIGINLLMDIFFSVIFFSGIYAVSEKKTFFFIGLFLALPVLLAEWLTHLVEIPSALFVGKLFGALFWAYTATIILVHLFREKKITDDVIIGSICVYFLIGLMWAFIFSVLEIVQPGSFQIALGQDPDLSHFNYYSFVTLTTLGYGDITPISDPARSLALLEAIMGILYIAILIARLVGIHIGQSLRNAS